MTPIYSEERALDRASHDDQIAALNVVIDKQKAELEALREAIAYLKERKAHYKGITERVRIVLQSAWLLDEEMVRVSVLADALLGDGPLRPDGPRVKRSF
jgi:hypothetical protein